MTAPYLTIRIQHVQGAQSIARAELAAITWIIQHASIHQWSQQIVITTDFQYAIGVIHQVTRPEFFPSWHQSANADLLQIIADCWSPTQFLLRKVRSHQDLDSLPPGLDQDDTMGNSWADHAAVRARLTDHPVVDELVNKANI